MDSLKKHHEVLLELLKEFDRVCRKHNIRYTLFAGSALGAVRHQGFIPWDDDLDVALLREDYDRLLQLDREEWNDMYYMQGEYSEHWPVHFSKLRKNNTTCLEKYHPKDSLIHQGIYIDIFPIDNASDNLWVRKLQFVATKFIVAKSLVKRGYETDSYFKKVFMYLSYVFPLKPFYALAILKKTTHCTKVHSFLGGSSKFEKGVFDKKWFTEISEVSFESLLVPISSHYHDLLTMQYGDYMALPSEEERKYKVHAILVDTQKNYTEYETYRDGMNFDVLTRNIR